MRKFFSIVAAFVFMCRTYSQDVKSSQVPMIVKSACTKRFPTSSAISWEKENGNYEANWGGRSGEDTSAQFTPTGIFVELEKAINISELPASIITYVKEHDNRAKIKEARIITDVNGKVSYEAEVKGKDLMFDENGRFLTTAAGD
jgi:hypothetical protein